MSGSVRRFLVDTNIIIYISNGVLYLDDFLKENDEMFLSSISYMEACGFSYQDKKEEEEVVKLCTMFHRFPISEAIEKQTILIRKSMKIKLPDAIIAATAIVHNLTLVTRNESDFKNISGLKVLNPFLV
jgi:predicted nucleic acid-binding protein